jgi:hypothetical protein
MMMSGNPTPFPNEAAPATARDRRVRVRHTQPLKTFCQKGNGDLDQVWWMGNVRNLSGSGIAFIIQHRFEPGMILTLEVENAGQTFSNTLQVQVVRVLPQGDSWFLGCTFLEELTDDEVQALV